MIVFLNRTVKYMITVLINRYFFLSNATVINYFTTFLQTIDVANSY